MSRVSADQSLMPSVLDRLLDQGARAPAEGPASGPAVLARLKAAVKRDLEWLLNSRQVVADLPDDLRQIDRSLLTYGLPDFTPSSLNNTADQMLLRRSVEQAITRFEPRLTRVVVTLEAGREFERALRFRIDALLRVDPEPEPVTFDSVLQLTTKAFVVKDEGG